MKSEPRMIERDRREWCFSFKASKLWLTAVQTDKSGSKHTEREYCRGLKAFCAWVGKNPDQLIMERKTELKCEDTEMDAENKLREFCAALENKGTVSRSTIACKYHAPVKSFYNYNNVPLKLRTPKHATIEREPHTVEQIKALMNIANMRERVFIMLLKDSGMSREDAVTVKYGDIKAEYEAEKEIIHIKAMRQKELIQYDTFIGKNAIDTIKTYLEYRKRKGETITDNTPLIATLDGQGLSPENLSQLFDRLSAKVGFKTSPHRFRKFFESHLGLSAPSILVKYWMGHALGVEKSYFIPPIEKQREKYAESYKELDMSEKPSLFEQRAQQIKDMVKLMYPNQPEKLQLTDLLITKAQTETNPMQALDRLPEHLQHAKLDKVKLAGKCEDDQNCQHVVNESELEEYMKQGFRFVAVLPSGKILVSNED